MRKINLKILIMINTLNNGINRPKQCVNAIYYTQDGDRSEKKNE